MHSQCTSFSIALTCCHNIYSAFNGRACTPTKIMIPQICAPAAALYYGFRAEVPDELSNRGFLLQLQWWSRDSIYRKQSCISDRDENLEFPSGCGRMKPALHAYTVNTVFVRTDTNHRIASNSWSGLADAGKNSIYWLQAWCSHAMRLN